MVCLDVFFVWLDLQLLFWMLRMKELFTLLRKYGSLQQNQVFLTLDCLVSTSFPIESRQNSKKEEDTWVGWIVILMCIWDIHLWLVKLTMFSSFIDRFYCLHFSSCDYGFCPHYLLCSKIWSATSSRICWNMFSHRLTYGINFILNAHVLCLTIINLSSRK